MLQQKSILTAIAILIISGGVLGSAYFFQNNSKTKTEIIPPLKGEKTSNLQEAETIALGTIEIPGIYSNKDIGIQFDYPSELILREGGFWKEDMYTNRFGERDNVGIPTAEFSLKVKNTSIDNFILQTINPNYSDLFKNNQAKWKQIKKIGTNEFIELSHSNFDYYGCSYFLNTKKMIARFSSNAHCGEDKLLENVLKSVVIVNN